MTESKSFSSAKRLFQSKILLFFFFFAGPFGVENSAFWKFMSDGELGNKLVY